MKKCLVLIVALILYPYCSVAYGSPATPLAYTSSVNPLVIIPVTPASPLPICVYDSSNNSGYVYTSNGNASCASFKPGGGGGSSTVLAVTTSNVNYVPTLSATTTSAGLATLYSGLLSFNPSTEALAIGAASATSGVNLDLGSTTGSLLLPTGTTGQRPTGVAGMVRYNSTTPAIEAYYSNAWNALGGGGSSTGANLTVQLSNGSGGFSAATGVLYNATTLGLNIDGVNAISLPDNGTDTSGVNIGSSAGLSQTSSPNNNIAIGSSALSLATTAIDNVAIGSNALASILSDSGNTAVGFDALQNMAIGNTTTLGANTAFGFQALKADTTGFANVAIGYNALVLATSSIENTAIGYLALSKFTGNQSSFQGPNVAVGYEAGLNSTISNDNTFVGGSAGSGNTTGQQNVYIGNGSGLRTSTGGENIGIGFEAYGGTGNTASGSNNVVIGSVSMPANNGGSSNTCVGDENCAGITTGASNTVVGAKVASTTLTTGSNNVLIGTSSSIDVGSSSTSNTIAIGAGSTAIWSVTGTGTPSTAANTINGTLSLPNITNSDAGDYVCYNSGVIEFDATACLASLRKYKENIKPLTGALTEVMLLRPVQFKFKKETKWKQQVQIGLIAEDVEKVDKRLAGYTDKGDLETVDYARTGVLAISAIQEQQKEIDALAGGKSIIFGHPCFFNLLVCPD